MVPFAYPLVYMKTLFKLFVVLTFPINNLNFVLIQVTSILRLDHSTLMVLLAVRVEQNRTHLLLIQVALLLFHMSDFPIPKICLIQRFHEQESNEEPPPISDHDINDYLPNLYFAYITHFQDIQSKHYLHNLYLRYCKNIHDIYITYLIFIQHIKDVKKATRFWKRNNIIASVPFQCVD